MRKATFTAISLAFFLAACGGGGDSQPDSGGIDVGADAADNGTPDGGGGGGECNPVEQTGCEADEKCHFVYENYPDLGRTACGPEGTKGATEACTRDADGYDDCAEGFQCFAGTDGQGTCKEICGSTPDTCPADFGCTVYSTIFTDQENVGVCDATCNVVEQTRDADGAEACGSTNTDEPELGCYGIFGTSFTCSPSGDPAKVHDSDATADDGNVYINSCAPGFLPLLQRATDDETPICMAMCTPVETYEGNTDGASGDPNGWNCAARNALGTNDNPMECRYFTFFEEAPSADRNYIGFCMQPGNYLYDSDMDMEPDTPWPLCVDLANTDTDGNDIPDHAEWGCAPVEATANGTKTGKTLRDLGFELAIPEDQALEMFHNQK